MPKNESIITVIQAIPRKWLWAALCAPLTTSVGFGGTFRLQACLLALQNRIPQHVTPYRPGDVARAICSRHQSPFVARSLSKFFCAAGSHAPPEMPAASGVRPTCARKLRASGCGDATVCSLRHWANVIAAGKLLQRGKRNQNSLSYPAGR